MTKNEHRSRPGFIRVKSHTIYHVTLLLLSLGTCFAGDAKREEFRLRATVKNVVTISSYSGTVTPVESDPRFAVIVRVDSVKPVLTNFTIGGTVTFAVHSPSRLFGASETRGKTYDLILRRETMDGKAKFTSLEVLR